MKYCKSCNQTLPESEFHKNKSTKDGLTWQCKTCKQNYKKKYESGGAGRKKTWTWRTLLRHRDNGYNVIITKEDLYNLAELTTHCPYCGINLSWDNTKLSDNSPSLDRIDNEQYLSPDNVEIICARCNRTKSNRTKKEFIEYCKTIVSRSEQNE